LSSRRAYTRSRRRGSTDTPSARRAHQERRRTSA
jgi:hypothetical protein